MKDLICVNVGKDHIYQCTTRIIGRAGESEIARLEITIPDELNDYWAYLDFRKPSGETFKTPRLDIVDNAIAYDVPLYVLSERGHIEVQLVLQKESGEIWKSSVKKYENLASINATDDIPDKEDFIANAQRILDQAGKLVVNAIDNIETQTVSKSASEELYSFSDQIYSMNGGVLDTVVKDNRSNYKINGEPATVITVPTAYDGEGNEYPSYLGLESATWQYTYVMASSYGMKGIYCKDSDFYYSNYQCEITVTYDEEEEAVTTTIDTPLEDILATVEEGKEVVCKWNNLILNLVSYETERNVEFTAFSGASGNNAYLYRIVYSNEGLTAEKRRFTSYTV